MDNPTRRTLLRYVVVTPFIGLNSSLVFSKDNDDKAPVEHELAVVLTQWLDKMKCLPSEYLDLISIDITSREAIDSYVANDFRAGETISINGLILSKSEAAILAEFAALTLL